MARRARRQLVEGLVLIGAVLVGLAGLAGAPAQAAPRPPAPNAITVTGPGMPRPVTIRADADPLLFAALLDQVSWLTGAGHGAAPRGVDLGPKYTVTVLVNNAAVRTYDLYPLASGGPRAFRPAKQPGRAGAAAWFFGRLTMPEALQAAGAPLSEAPGVGTGGIGGGERLVPESAADDAQDMAALLGQLRQVLLLNVSVILAITVGLGGIALLVRRRTR